MKKLLLIFAIAVAVVACNNDNGDRYDYIQGNFEVLRSEWMYESNADADFWYCEKPFPRLTDHVIDNSIMSVTRVMEGTKMHLPANYWIDRGDGTFARQIDCQYRRGVITFYVTQSDWSADRPEAMLFHADIFVPR